MCIGEFKDTCLYYKVPFVPELYEVPGLLSTVRKYIKEKIAETCQNRWEKFKQIAEVHLENSWVNFGICEFKHGLLHYNYETYFILTF